MTLVSVLVWGYCIALAHLAAAHRMCSSCIPLEDLLAPGYGISLSLEGLSAAAAYHNGAVWTLSSKAGSREYRELMSSIVERDSSSEPRSSALRCPEPVRRESPEPFDKDIPKLVLSYAGKWMREVREIFNPPLPTKEPVPVPLDETEQMLQAELLSLEPFATMPPDYRSDLTITIQIPSWLISSPQACSLFRAAETIFGRVTSLESPSSSAFTALGHELCRTSTELYECTGPGRLMILEYDGKMATASAMKTPFYHTLPTKYSTLRSQDPSELAAWIDSFLNATNPNLITLAGSAVQSGVFQEALRLSKAAGRIESDSMMPPKDILVKGAAQVAKDAMENHDSNCDEFEECIVIRREADKIGGRYKYRRPKLWPAVNDRHWRLSEEADVEPESEVLEALLHVEL